MVPASTLSESRAGIDGGSAITAEGPHAGEKPAAAFYEADGCRCLDLRTEEAKASIDPPFIRDGVAYDDFAHMLVVYNLETNKPLPKGWLKHCRRWIDKERYKQLREEERRAEEAYAEQQRVRHVEQNQPDTTGC